MAAATDMTTQELVNNVCDQLGKEWVGKLPAKKQREIFGVFLGKGTIYVDIEGGEITHTVKVCYGADWADTSGIRISPSGLTHEVWVQSNRNESVRELDRIWELANCPATEH